MGFVVEERCANALRCGIPAKRNVGGSASNAMLTLLDTVRVKQITNTSSSTSDGILSMDVRSHLGRMSL